jgi:hypothetical protein
VFFWTMANPPLFEMNLSTSLSGDNTSKIPGLLLRR